VFEAYSIGLRFEPTYVELLLHMSSIATKKPLPSLLLSPSAVTNLSPLRVTLAKESNTIKSNSVVPPTATINNVNNTNLSIQPFSKWIANQLQQQRAESQLSTQQTKPQSLTQQQSGSASKYDAPTSTLPVLLATGLEPSASSIAATATASTVSRARYHYGITADTIFELLISLHQVKKLAHSSHNCSLILLYRCNV
jgi:hypothetical protein